MGGSALARGGCRIEKRRSDGWAIIIGAIALIFASVLFGQSQSAKGIGAPSGSTYSTEDGGLSGIYEVLSGQGKASRWELGFDRLPEKADRLVVWDPGEIDSRGWQQLLAWVARGHTLVISADNAHLLGKVSQAGPDTALPVAASPATVGVGEVAVGTAVFAPPDGKAQVEVSRSDGSPVLISWRRGQGRIYHSADSSWLANGLIGQKSNLTLALRLLTPGPGKETLFDEYSHGYAAPQRWWQMLRGAQQLFILVMVLALALFYWAYGAGFGAPQPLPVSPPRAAVEYVYFMSHLYRRARARKAVLQALYRSLTDDLSRLLGGITGLSHETIAKVAGERAGVSPAEMQALLDRMDPGRRGTPSDTELISLARETASLQRRIRNAGYRDQSLAADSK